MIANNEPKFFEIYDTKFIFSDRLFIVYIFSYQLPFPADFCVEKTVFANKNLPTMGRVRTKTVKKAARVIIEK